ncbi:MAG TPA: DUF2269 family protein [Actinomycetota bacterium]|jgi:MFS family permease|nr:DUF2269 family protein [Actinomycetota bacterium]
MLADTVFWWKLWKLWHLVGAFGFVAAHGATAAVALKLRRERSPERIRALLDLSRSTRGFMYLSLIVLLIGGIANGFVLHVWGRGWIWTAIVLLVLLIVAAFPLAVPYYVSIRRALERESTAEELEALLASSRPLVVMWVETIGILLIIWLMVFKPF